MQNFTQEEFQPSASAILFVKQFARLANTQKTLYHGHTRIPLVAVC